MPPKPLLAGFAEGKTAGFTRGENAGLAKAVLAVLAARGLPVSADTRALIEACKAATLDRLIARATTAVSIEKVIAAAEERG